ncbi:MAG: hypothetical protein IJD60_02830, partial [Clostridia bacterium]|nr:hypothetical protein [Clostridia bacterium]
MKKTGCAWLVLLILLLTAVAAPASAAMATQDGLTVTLETDKQSYVEGDTVNAALTIHNGSDAVVRDVSVQYAAPAFCTAEAGMKTVQKVAGVAAGETVTLNAAFVVKGAQAADLPQTGDSSHMLLWLLLGGMSVFALLKMGKDARKQL